MRPRSGIRRQWETRLRQRLIAEGWEIRNETKLPVVCFTRNSLSDAQLLRICARVGQLRRGVDLDDSPGGQGDGPARVHYELSDQIGARRRTGGRRWEGLGGGTLTW